ncbi:MAG: ribonuclease P protein component [Opitutaceae bacterium]|jgi:ribonuclease P protein component|nr:ribonuclease P protein component [Opitutaceae bacterium]
MRYRAGQHIRRQPDIRRVRTRGRRHDCGAFVVLSAPRDTADGTPETAARSLKTPALPRAAFVASRVAVGNAVLRNRAKRRLRELFRANQDILPPDTDFLFLARRAVLDAPFAVLARNFRAALGGAAAKTS